MKVSPRVPITQIRRDRNLHTRAISPVGGAGPKSSPSLLLPSSSSDSAGCDGNSSSGAGGEAGPKSLRRFSLPDGLLGRAGKGLEDSSSSARRFRFARR